MKRTKQILLFVVEGENDSIALAATMTEIFTAEQVKFRVMNGDITSRNTVCPNNIKKILGNEIKAYVEEFLHVNKKDIYMVVHLVDTDGAFVDQSCVTSDESLPRKCKIYNANSIIANDRQSIIDRNTNKSRIMRLLKDMDNVWGNIPYKLYYFSCNLDHVFCNDPNPLLKKRNALYIDRKYSVNPQLFIQDISDPSLAAHGDYCETWEYIQQGVNSLNRNTNLHLLFQLVSLSCFSKSF